MADKHAPDSLKYQWRLLALVLRSDWATSLDKSIALEIVDNYSKDHKNSRASLSYLQAATGAERRHVVASTRRLVERGPFSVALKGKGTRPTAYELHFDLVADTASGALEGTTTEAIGGGSSGYLGGTTGSAPGGTTGASSGSPWGTESDLLEVGLQPGLHVGGNFVAGAAPPPSSVALGAAGAVPAPGGFDAFWTTYPRKHGRAKARAEWEAIAPGEDLAAEVIAAARAWAAHYADHGTHKKWMPEPANWLRGERWAEDLPISHSDAKGAAIAKAKANAPAAPAPAPANDDVPPAPRHGLPVGRHTATIVTAEVRTKDGTKTLDLSFAIEGATYPHGIVLEGATPQAQEDGQRELGILTYALGLGDECGADAFVGLPFTMTVGSSGAFKYEPVVEAQAAA